MDQNVLISQNRKIKRKGAVLVLENFAFISLCSFKSLEIKAPMPRVPKRSQFLPYSYAK